MLISLLLLAALAVGWCLYRNRRYPLAPGYPLMNKFVVPTLLASPALLPTANRKLAGMAPPALPAGVVKRTEQAVSADGSTVRMTVYEPENAAAPKPCLVYCHGGGFFFADAPYIHAAAAEYAKETGCAVFFVHYRTSDAAPCPAPFQDCFACLEAVWAQSAAWGLDRARIAVGGDSAGGALAAACALRARDEGRVKLCFQLLVYPVTDSRMETASMARFTDSPLWNARLNRRMWEIYLRDGAPERPEYAAPMLATDFSGLPPAYVEVEEFDCLHDEGAAYADALSAAGCPVQFEDVKGAFHGFDFFLGTEKTRELMEVRCRALRAAFRDGESRA